MLVKIVRPQMSMHVPQARNEKLAARINDFGVARDFDAPCFPQALNLAVANDNSHPRLQGSASRSDYIYPSKDEGVACSRLERTRG